MRWVSMVSKHELRELCSTRAVVIIRSGGGRGEHEHGQKETRDDTHSWPHCEAGDGY